MTGQYNLLPIIILLMLLYLSSYFLYTNKNLKASTHKLIWDIILIVSALVAVTSGLMMILLINLGILPLDMDLLFWHVETAIIMAVTAIFHVHIHWKPLKETFNGS